MRSSLLLAGMALALALSGCGGGGDSSTTTTTTPATTSSTPAISSTLATNQVSISVGAGQYGGVNILTTSVTICVPGTSTCQTIPNVLVDTGSYGLRLFSSAVTLSLQSRTAAVGGTLTNCAYFGLGTAYGRVAAADIKLNGETASNTSVQLIADPNFTTVPATCASQGLQYVTQPSQIAANGILGIGVETLDCPDCVANTFTTNNQYFGCTTASSCTASTASAALQVVNPVSNFAVDNNGDAVTLPSISASGVASATGVLTFGIGTQTNNSLGSATTYSTIAQEARFTTVFGGVSGSALIDSGSNGLFFNDSSITVCAIDTGFYCPASTLTLSAVMEGQNGNNSSQSFSISNAETIFNSGAYAANNVGGTSSSLFDWGLPFFYGRTIYNAIDGKSTSGGTGPYYAF